jgi:hypothetical protein
MMRVSNDEGLLRVRDRGEQPVTALELFFDLVYVFAVTQFPYRLLDHLTAGIRCAPRRGGDSLDARSTDLRRDQSRASISVQDSSGRGAVDTGHLMQVSS